MHVELKRTLSIFSLAIIVIIELVSCKKNKNPTPTHANTGVDVYLVGYAPGDSAVVAIYWKNGLKIILPESFSEGNAIAIKGNDVYVAGTKYYGSQTHALYWKNGVVSKIAQNSAANAIVIDGNDLYVGGSIDGKAAYWKNGIVVNLTDSLVTSSVSGIAIDGDNVYMCGTSRDVHGASTATYWKNGVPTYLKGFYTSSAHGIAIKDNDVYVVGTEAPTPYTVSAVYWINNSPTILYNGNKSSLGLAIAISGSDIYVAGNFVLGNQLTHGYWKNGVVTEFQDNANSSDGIAINGNDVYVSGTTGITGSSTGYWKNSNFISVSSEPSYITGIAVIPK